MRSLETIRRGVDANATLDQRAQASEYGFQADVARLLELMTHSVYSERDIFLRELISNSADACEKLRYEALANETLAAEAGAPLVTVALDKAARTLIVTDNGVGMSREELISALGTIASSGTRAFLDKLASEETGDESQALSSGNLELDFYSAFMVADKIEVATRRAGAGEAFLWTSDGKGSYSIALLDNADAPKLGTKVTLHLKTDAEEFLEPHRIEQIVREHSGAIAIPIDLVDEPEKEPRRLTDGAALWTKPKSEIAQEQYVDFYRQLAGQFDEPALTVHWRAEGRTEYTVLAFVPGVSTLRFIRSNAQGTDQALRPARSDLSGFRSAAGMAALHAHRRRQRRHSAQCIARDGAEKPGHRFDRQSDRDAHPAGDIQARRNPSRKNSLRFGKISAPY